MLFLFIFIVSSYENKEIIQTKTLYRQLLVWFYGILTFVGYLTPNPFYVNNQFYLKQFSLTSVLNLIVKNISISNYSSSYI